MILNVCRAEFEEPRSDAFLRELCASAGNAYIPRTVMSEMFNRNAIGVRAHADGVGVKRSNVSSEAVQGIVQRKWRRDEK